MSNIRSVVNNTLSHFLSQKTLINFQGNQRLFIYRYKAKTFTSKRQYIYMGKNTLNSTMNYNNLILVLHVCIFHGSLTVKLIFRVL